MSQRYHSSSTGCGMTDADIRANFQDLHPPLDRMQAAVEADRCLFCFDAPCITACPTAIDIPKFIHQISTGNLEGSAQTILEANIMGGTCARVCPTEELCEQACVRNTSEDQPVKIGHLQRHAVDHLIDRVLDGAAPNPFVRGEPTGKTVAIVGAGPAGLSAAHRLAMAGHDVIVHDARPKAGGLNEYGLAAYKMVDDFAQREIAFLMDVGGITFRFDSALGRNITLDTLAADHDAVFIGIGLGDTNHAAIPGRDLPGVQDAIAFIEALRRADDPAAMRMEGDVVVIGGGNTAIDAAVQARRLGADSVTLAYRRGEGHMPATDWEVDLARTNDVAIRLWSRPTEFRGTDSVESVTLERTELKDGKLTGSGRTYSLPADHVMLAIGQTLADTGLDGLTLAAGKITVDEHFQTSRPGVYAGGDCIDRGVDLTVQAVEDGKQAAAAIHARLTGTA
ncbi:NAD(P)-dependent oxidoreductase [Yunchengibacter salinarum]|uniref:NAD(P)-dependent oxidoreductase n=1 Tax=Yunchengibacter salinarum TaxID=3133399 RepID=UPI0035B5A495